MLLMTNVDNINADQVPYLIEQLLAKGAKNVHVVNAMTKKGRPEYIIFVDTPEDRIKNIGSYLASEIGTLGIRIIKEDHLAYKYSFQNMSIRVKDKEDNMAWEGSVQVKIVQDDTGQPLSARIEYEDLKIAAGALEKAGSGITFQELKQMVETEVLRELKKTEYTVEMKMLDSQ